MRRSRRSLAPILLGVTVLVAGACSSSNDASTTGTTVAAAAPSTTAKGATKATVSPEKCKSVVAFQQATIVANKPESQTPPNQDKVTKSLDATAAALKKSFPGKTAPDNVLRTQTDTQLTYLKKLVAAQNPTPAEKDASVKARDAMNAFYAGNCKTAPAGGTPTTAPKSPTTKKPAGSTTTTAKPAGSTTTAAPATTTTAAPATTTTATP